MELIRSAAYPTELWSLLKYKYGGGQKVLKSKVDKVLTVMWGLFLRFRVELALEPI